MFKLFVKFFVWGSLGFAITAYGQETRSYILSVDFGSTDRLQDFWLPWGGSGTQAQITRNLPNVFDQDGINIKIATPCISPRDIDLYTNCGLGFIENPNVAGTPLNMLVSNGLRVLDSSVNFEFSGLPEGVYDIKFFFHDSSRNSDNRDISVTLIDGRAPGGKLLSSSVNYSTSTNPIALSTFRIPVEARVGRTVRITLSSSNSDFLLNGFEFTQYRLVEQLPSGIEVIGKTRNTEALISGFRSSDESILACAIQRNGDYYFGSWYEGSDECQAIIDQQLDFDTSYKFVKFDPFFYWQPVSTPQVPNNALSFTETADGDTYYPCAAQESGNRFFAGVYVPSQINFCQAEVEGSIRYYSQFYIYSEK
ncbi:hypothetical protein [Pseudobacteriovorax antillogorgiicola]|uniref:Uncharacterized protein n=1 Tax=Pseudobacteriovorax antillogorgiicola TaxID=1513793 RepID=A0A1Y6BKH4_9BACT|nr:hypothetical protein [Pseudobacteriovorax antillogorgiicola]TCS55418.1 hypothetical protein EDD56_105139 [Pseudobacteriovorax antillogorgiicola]SMF12622.1 hypothetical protein SAMN06296036_105185 [Pseudobacteriovorax antillogorgiicola]